MPHLTAQHIRQHTLCPCALYLNDHGPEEERAEVHAIVEHLMESGQIITAPGGLMFSGKAIEWIRRKLIDYLERKGEVPVSDFREHINSSRKFAIPLLQYFEDEGTIVRDGDVRRLKKP